MAQHQHLHVPPGPAAGGRSGLPRHRAGRTDRRQGQPAGRGLRVFVHHRAAGCGEHPAGRADGQADHRRDRDLQSTDGSTERQGRHGAAASVGQARGCGPDALAGRRPRADLRAADRSRLRHRLSGRGGRQRQNRHRFRDVAVAVQRPVRHCAQASAAEYGSGQRRQECAGRTASRDRLPGDRGREDARRGRLHNHPQADRRLQLFQHLREPLADQLAAPAADRLHADAGGRHQRHLRQPVGRTDDPLSDRRPQAVCTPQRAQRHRHLRRLRAERDRGQLPQRQQPGLQAVRGQRNTDRAVAGTKPLRRLEQLQSGRRRAGARMVGAGDAGSKQQQPAQGPAGRK